MLLADTLWQPASLYWFDWQSWARVSMEGIFVIECHNYWWFINCFWAWLWVHLFSYLQAACSDISAKPNPYKLLYAFEMHQQNWRKAATYIYLYSVRLKNEMALRNYQNIALFFQERLNGISAAINCLHLVHPMHAWIDSQMAGNHLQSASHPNKKARVEEEQCNHHVCNSPELFIFVYIFGCFYALRSTTHSHKLWIEKGELWSVVD